MTTMTLHGRTLVSTRSILQRGCLRKRFTRRTITGDSRSGRDRLLHISEEVKDALATGKPVVALETTIYTHGYPYPENVALASHLESLVRVHGGIPATIGVLNGVAHVGMQPEELIQLIKTAGEETTWKLSRRDLGFIGGLGLRGQKLNGGTTIAATMILAHLAGIRIFATGGLGGVHRGGENSMDISADLTELGRTPVAVISSGCKSFLDIPRTLEYLETQGVGVGTFADGRRGKVDFPAFWSRDSGVRSPQTILDEADAAAIVFAQSTLPVHSGLLFANPVPEKAAMDKGVIDEYIAVAVAEADKNGIRGNANTPYILKRIRELSDGATVTANTALVEANIIRGTKVAVELAKLERRDGAVAQRPFSTTKKAHNCSPTPSSNAKPDVPPQDSPDLDTVDVFVAGSLASDTICDYQPLSEKISEVSPVMHTSNPSKITQSAGGVGHNVAVAAHLAGAKVALASVVADDLAGQSLLEHIRQTGLPSKYIRQLPTSEGARTAQYVAVNDTKKDLTMAMADMSILLRPELESTNYWLEAIKKSCPKWAVVDANWSPAILSSILSAAKSQDVKVAFEPVSTAKAARLFHSSTTIMSPSKVVPNHIVSLASPNQMELTSIYESARDTLMFESEAWWKVIDSFGFTGAASRDRLVAVAGSDLVEQGIPQQCIQLLPFIPNLVTKLGYKGSLLTTLLSQRDEKLTDPEHARFVIARNFSNDSDIGGVYMRLLPPTKQIEQSEIVSVNGIGDTMLGVIVAGLAKGHVLDEIVPLAQKAAVMTLKSAEAVSLEVRGILDQI